MKPHLTPEDVSERLEDRILAASRHDAAGEGEQSPSARAV